MCEPEEKGKFTLEDQGGEGGEWTPTTSAGYTRKLNKIIKLRAVSKAKGGKQAANGTGNSLPLSSYFWYGYHTNLSMVTYDNFIYRE